jgi:hypothetical protein
VKGVKLGNAEFAAGHRILGSSKTLAAALLTPAVQQSLLSLSKAHSGHFGVSFVGTRAYAALIVPPSKVDADWLLPGDSPARWQEVETDLKQIAWLFNTVAPMLEKAHIAADGEV